MNKETMNTLLITVGIELAVVIALVGVFLILKIKKGKKADRNAAQELVKTVKKNEKGRRESLLQVFGESYDLEEEELNAAVDEFLNREKAFFKTLISVYVERDAMEFSKLAGALEKMVKPYSDLALSAELSVDNEQLEALQQENQTLGKELDESKKVMDELLSEYTATFDKEGEGKAPEAAQNNQAEEKSESEIPVETIQENVTEVETTAIESDELDLESEAGEMEGTLELTVDAFVEEEFDEVSNDAEELALDEDKAVDILTEEKQVLSDEIEAELLTDDDNENPDVMIDELNEIIETEKNEVSLDEFDEELETEVA